MRKFFPFFAQIDPKVAAILTPPGWTTVWPSVAKSRRSHRSCCRQTVVKAVPPDFSEFLYPAPPKYTKGKIKDSP